MDTGLDEQVRAIQLFGYHPVVEEVAAQLKRHPHKCVSNLCHHAGWFYGGEESDSMRRGARPES